jgi:hypothetical protein
VIDQMVKAASGKGDTEGFHVREVRLTELTRPVELRKKDLLARPSNALPSSKFGPQREAR